MIFTMKDMKDACEIAFIDGVLSFAKHVGEESFYDQHVSDKIVKDFFVTNGFINLNDDVYTWLANLD